MRPGRINSVEVLSSRVRYAQILKQTNQNVKECKYSKREDMAIRKREVDVLTKKNFDSRVKMQNGWQSGGRGGQLR